jgi:hypothetical protein
MFRVASTSARRLAVPAALALALGVAGCASDPTQPATAIAPDGHPQYNSSTTSGPLAKAILAQGLLRSKSLKSATVTQVVSRAGGTIALPGTGLTLEVPAGAFDAPTMTFTVTSLAGITVAYDFQPHGTVFNVPLRVVQSLAQTNLKNISPKPGFVSEWSGAYFDQASSIDSKTGVAVVSELLSVDLSVIWTRNEISFAVSHFSGYMVCTGREEGGNE